MRTAHRPFATRTLLLALCYTAAALLTLTSYAQSTLPSSMGTRFVFSVPPVEGVFGRSATVRLTVSSRDTAMVTCYEHTQRVTPDSQVVFFHEIRNGRIMPYIGIPDSADAVYTNRAVVVTSTAPVSLVCTVISRMGGESFTVLPE
ncbi:MAG: hypothetical protein JNL32_02065, partial [Candidatus Kapabacteria bacterium]|nr:hypothetical protein [Candidatus Kapabacteria bacterium]